MRHNTGIPGSGRVTAALGAAAVLLILAMGHGHSETLLSSRYAGVLPAGAGDAAPTAAWTAFCKRLPDECRIDTSEPTAIALTPAVSDLIAATNLLVNTTIKPMTDRQHWGVEDRWDFPDDGFGDCEDYQLLKRKLLTDAGLPRRAMRMTVVIDAEGDGHAVLTIRTDRGDLILDNKRDAVLAWNETGYEFIKREGADTAAWVALGGEPARTVVASRSVPKARGSSPARR
jgi:predicted transglutaminase-like cysteine proteinase